MNVLSEKGRIFRQLHESPGAFFIPNPWDVGSARVLEGLGYPALATTSSGFALTLGRSDGEVSRAEKLDHCGQLASATTVPISADLEHGFADDPEGVVRTIEAFAASGIVGGSIEDYSRAELYPFDQALERVQAAVEATRGLDFPFTLTARAEQLLRGEHDLDVVIRRLEAFGKAGADVLYAPGLKSLEEVQQVATALRQPINVLASFIPGPSLDEFAAAGAKRLSVGGSLAWEAYGRLTSSAGAALTSGGFDFSPKPPSTASTPASEIRNSSNENCVPVRASSGRL